MPFIPVKRLLSESPELKNTKKHSRLNSDSTRNTENTSTVNPDEEINIPQYNKNRASDTIEHQYASEN